MNILIVFTPIFSFCMLIEFFIYYRRRERAYGLKDTFANLTMGLGNLILGTIFSFLFIAVYQVGYQMRVFQSIEMTVYTYAILFLLEDYCYYWFHRVSHVSRFFWSGHETHHSSESYNFSTALRQTWSGIFFSWIFWLPLCLIGFKPEWILFQQSVSLIYQFFIHTELINCCGVFENFMNTPSHHRVHHAKDIPYLDCNYGGILIIWDKLHHTFNPEKERATYGTLTPVNSNFPLYIGSHMWFKLIKDVIHTPGLINKIKMIFYPPGWTYQGESQTTRELKKLYAQHSSRQHMDTFNLGTRNEKFFLR